MQSFHCHCIDFYIWILISISLILQFHFSSIVTISYICFSISFLRLSILFIYFNYILFPCVFHCNSIQILYLFKFKLLCYQLLKYLKMFSHLYISLSNIICNVSTSKCCWKRSITKFCWLFLDSNYRQIFFKDNEFTERVFPFLQTFQTVFKKGCIETFFLFFWSFFLKSLY